MGHHKTSRMILTTALLYSNWKTSPRPSSIPDFENFSKMVSSQLIPFTGALPISEMKTIVPDEFVLHKLQKKIKVHMWLAYDERFLTTDNLAKRGIHISSSCLLCEANSETSCISFSIAPTYYNYENQNVPF